MSDELILKELARLRRELDDIKAVVFPKSNTTTREERKALRKHIEQLSEQINGPKPNKIKVKKTNRFIVGQIVELLGSIYNDGRTKGIVNAITCKAALPSIKKCDKKKCDHDHRPIVWVAWPDRKIFAYHFSKLRMMTEEDLKPKIGRELSGKIGLWTYDAETKLWKKDGSDKEYTQEEFGDYLYWEAHPDDKEEGDDFLRKLAKVPQKT